MRYLDSCICKLLKYNLKEKIKNNFTLMLQGQAPAKLNAEQS